MSYRSKLSRVHRVAGTTENEALQQPYSKENPLQIKYIKLVRTFLWTIGGWPGELFGEKVPLIIRYHKKHIPVQTTLLFLCQNNYLIKFTKDMDLFVKGHCYLTTILSVLTTIRTALPSFKGYGQITKKFLLTFHLINYQTKDEYFNKIYATLEKLSLYMTRYMISMMVCGIILLNAPICYRNYENGAFSSKGHENVTLEFSIYYTFPGFDPIDKFIFCSIFNIYLTYNCAISVCGIDLLLSLMVFQVIGHILILRNNLEKVPRPMKNTVIRFDEISGKECLLSVQMYSLEENEEIFKKLVEYIDHHRNIVRFTSEMSSFFGPMLAFNYLFHLVCCCLLLLECSQGDTDAILRFGPLTVIVFGQLIQISITFEVVGSVSEKLVDCVYCLPWECMDTRNRRLVCILLHRVQTPIGVNVLGLTSVGVQTMAGILKTTFTYFTFLRSFAIN